MRQPLFLQAIASENVSNLWTIAVPVTLGLVAIYLLLPRPRPYPVLWGAGAAGLALLSGGWLLIEHEIALPESILFYAFSGIAIVGGGLLITQRNPVRAALSFALAVLSTCGLFLLQAAPFLMAATIIVYAGAIIVTFIFVIMLAQQFRPSDADDRSREPLLSCIAGFVLLGALLYVLNLDVTGRVPGSQFVRGGQAPTLPAENVAYLGQTLFTDYLIPVELGGTLLLVATIGAIAIAGRRSEVLR
jgi:NADH-quinone oxidoreductase subunit J